MTIYKVPGGWLFKYNFQPKSFYYYLESARNPLYAEATNINIDMSGHEVEYHVLPKEIKVAIAATQSILIEQTAASNKHLSDVIESITKRDN